jgi:hypothetical protein
MTNSLSLLVIHALRDSLSRSNLKLLGSGRPVCYAIYYRRDIVNFLISHGVPLAPRLIGRDSVAFLVWDWRRSFIR